MTAFNSGAVYSSQQVGLPEAVADHIFELAPYKTPLLSLLGTDSLPSPCINPTYHYPDQEHRPMVTTLNGAIGASTTGVTFTDAIYKAGDEVVIDTEVITLGTTSDNLTFAGCTRTAGAAAAAAHVDDAQCVSMDKWQAQGAAAGSGDIFIQPTQRTNYTSILTREVFVSRTANIVQRYGRPGVEYDYQAAYQLVHAFVGLEQRTLWGWDAAAVAGSTAGKTNGAYEVLAAAGSTTNCSSTDLDFDDIRPVIQSINSYEPDPNEVLVMLVPSYTKGVINSWGESVLARNATPDQRVVSVLGASVNLLDIDGRLVYLVPYPRLQSVAFMFTLSFMGVGPLVGPGGSGAFEHMLYARDGDRIKGSITGEYTNALACPSAHHCFYGLKTS